MDKDGQICLESERENDTTVHVGNNIAGPGFVETLGQDVRVAFSPGLTSHGNVADHEGSNMAGEQEVLYSDMEQHIRFCHERIMEFDKELKHRDRIVSLLQDTLSGLLTSLSSVSINGETFNENVSVLINRVQSASKLLQKIGKEDDEKLTTYASQEQNIICEEKFSTASSGASCVINLGITQQCGQQCVHSEEIAQIHKKVQNGFEKVGLPSSIFEKSIEMSITEKIECLATHALKHKLEANDAKKQLDELMKENQLINSTLHDKEAELKSMVSSLQDLKMELNKWKNKAMELRYPVEDTSNASFIGDDAKKDSFVVMKQDQSSQSVIKMNVMDKWLETLPFNVSQLVDDTVLSEYKLLKSENGLSHFSGDTLGGDSNSHLGRMEEKVSDGMFYDGKEPKSNDCMNSSATINVLEVYDKCVDVDSVGKIRKKDDEDEIKVNWEDHIKKQFIGCLPNGETVDELLLDLASKAKELVSVKEQLKLMKVSERNLQNQLKAAIASCTILEQRCAISESLVVNLNDLKDMYCKSDISKSSLDEENCGKIVDSSKAQPSTLSSDGNWCLSADMIEGCNDAGEEYLSNCLANIWKKIGSMVNFVNSSEGKTKAFSPKQFSSFKSSLENDFHEICLYLKRKWIILKQLKESFEAKSQFLDLQLELEKNLLNQSHTKSITSEEMVKDNENTLNETWRDDEYFSSGQTNNLTSLNLEMDSINSKVIECIRYCMEQDLEKRSVEIKMANANEIASLKQMQAKQLTSIKEEIEAKITKFQEQTEKVLAKLVTEVCSKEECMVQKSDEVDLECLHNVLDEKQREMFILFKERFEEIAAEQIAVATQVCKKSCNFKTSQEISLLKSIHECEKEEYKSVLEQQNLQEILLIRQEVNKRHKENINEVIKAVEAELKDLRCRCQDLALKTSFANSSAMNELKNSISFQCRCSLKELQGVWLNKFEKEAGDLALNIGGKAKELNVIPSCDISADEETDSHPQRLSVELQKSLLSLSEENFRGLVENHLSGMQQLMQKLQKEHINFKEKISQIETNWNLNVTASEEEKFLECKKDLEAKHAKDMESLRLYFEKKYAEVEKRYSEDVLTQRSRKCSHNCSCESLNNTSLSGSNAELECDQFFPSPEEIAVSRNVEDYENINLSVQLEGQVLPNVTVADVHDNGPLLPSVLDVRAQFQEERQKVLEDIIKKLEAKQEEELKVQIAIECKAYSDYIEEQEKCMMEYHELLQRAMFQFRENLTRLVKNHNNELNGLKNNDIAIEVGELSAEIDRMKSRHVEELLHVKKRMMGSHAEDIGSQKSNKEDANKTEQQKLNKKSDHEEELNSLKEEVKRKEAHCLELKCLYEAELEDMKKNFEARLQYEIEQTKKLIILSLEGQIQDLVGDEMKAANESHLNGNMLELKEIHEQSPSIKNGHHANEIGSTIDEQTAELNKCMTDKAEWSNPVLLEQHVDKLKEGIESDFNDRVSKSECFGRDLFTLKLQVNQMEQLKNVLVSKFGDSEVDLGDATSVTILHSDLDKLLKDRDKWKKISETLKKNLVDFLDYTHRCENELNDTLVQDILRLSGVNGELVSEENSNNGKYCPRRVHIAPESLTNVFERYDLDGEGEDMQLEGLNNEVKMELKQCLGRLQAEAAAILNISSLDSSPKSEAFYCSREHCEEKCMNKILSMESQLKAEICERDRLKVEIHTMKGLCEGYAAKEASLLERAAHAEAQLVSFIMKKQELQIGEETITEGFGEGNGSSNFDKQLQKLVQLREKARWVLKQHHNRGGNSLNEGDSDIGLSTAAVIQLIEELCMESDHLSEEARKDREDLQLQVDAADKQLRSTRAFLEEQAVEREQEREEYQRELNHLQEALSGRERDKGEKERMVTEETAHESRRQDQRTYTPPTLTVEALDQQVKDLTQLLKDTTDKKDDLESELKAAVDKIWDLREIIKELEGQVEGSLLIERDLRNQNEKLTAEMSLQSKKLNDLIEEIEALQSSLGYSIPGEMENESHTTVLEQALRNHCLQIEQAKSMGSSLKILRRQLLGLGSTIDRKTKELEALQVTPLTSGNCNSPSEDISVREQMDQATWRSESPMEDEIAEVGDESDNEDTDDLGLPNVPLAELKSFQEKFVRHFLAQEPLLKRIHDLEMQIQSLKHNEDELMTEREVLQSRVEEQLLQASELQARLDEVRRKGGHHIHCTTVTPIPSSPLTRSPIGSPTSKSSMPSFCCAGLADARHEIEKLTELIEKKELEVTQLKGALENSKKVVVSQEKELASKIKEEGETLEKLKELEKLKKEKEMLQKKFSYKIRSDSSLSSVLDTIFEAQNEEINLLTLQLSNVKEQLLQKSLLDSNVVFSQNKGSNTYESVKAETCEENKSGSYEEMEVLRGHGLSDMSFDKIDFADEERSQVPNKVWLHSTKVEAHHLSKNSPGLPLSPVTPGGRVVEFAQPALVEESLDEKSSLKVLDVGESVKEDVQVDKENIESTKEFVSAPKQLKDICIQTEEDTELLCLREAINAKVEEIKILTNKVDILLREKVNLSQQVDELREKIVWHSQHLEKYEEENCAREALINAVQKEKMEIKEKFEKSEQKMESLENLRIALEENLQRHEEEISSLNGRIEKYCKTNKDQHMLLKTMQQERKDLTSILSGLSLQSTERRTNTCGQEEDSCQLKVSSPASQKNSLRGMVTEFVNEYQNLVVELNKLNNERDNLQQELKKAAQYHSEPSLQECLDGRQSNGEEDSNEVSNDLGPISIESERGSSPSLTSLEQIMEKVKQEGIEVLSLSELAAGKISSSVDTPVCSPIFVNDASHALDNDKNMSGSVEKASAALGDDERLQFIMHIQYLENELRSKEREEIRKSDWLEFQEKEGHAGWSGMVEALGQKQRHELGILERLGEQRNARARLEAEVDQLYQKLAQAETEVRKVTSMLGRERSHVIRLESALHQEKANFSQLQISLETERKRVNRKKELDSKINKVLQSKLMECFMKINHLEKSLKEEQNTRMQLEVQLRQNQADQVYAAGSPLNQKLHLEVIASEQSRQLKKIEEDCERKALEEELQNEKQKRMECEQEILRLSCLIKSRTNQESFEPGESSRWSNGTFMSTPSVSDGSFNAEDVLHNLKGINQFFGSHIRQIEGKYTSSDWASLEAEKRFLEVKVCHLEQKLETVQSILEQERASWANERAFLFKNRLENNADISQQRFNKELKFQELVHGLYSQYWRSERKRKALVWQKRYFLSLLADLTNFKADMITELSKLTDEQRGVIDRVTGFGRIVYYQENVTRKPSSCHKPRSFRVVVWTVIATLKMKVLVLRSLTGIQVGCQSLLGNIPELVSSQNKSHLSPYHKHEHNPCAAGTSNLGCAVSNLSPGNRSRKNRPVGDVVYQRFP